jgi:uncharacterized protein (TIGR03382 family)
MNPPSKRTRVIVIAGAMMAGAISVALAAVNDLDLTPDNPLPFGPVGVGSQQVQPFMLHNGQPGMTSTLNWSFAGPGSGAFRIISPCTTPNNGMPCSSAGIAGASTIPVSIACMPTVAGTFNASINVNTTIDGDPASDFVNLTCTANSGGGGQLVLTPGSGHDFGDVEVDTTSVAFAFDLENDTGLDPLDNINISVGSGFILGAPCAGMQQCLISPMLGQGSHMPIEVSGAPTGLTMYNDSLIVSVGSAAAIADAPISVTGIPPVGNSPELSLDTSTVSIQAPFGTSNTQSVIVTNQGNLDLNVTLSIAGANPSRWEVTPSCASACTIAPGPLNSLTLVFRYSADAVGDQSATVRFVTNDFDDGENDFTLALTGLGTGGVLSAPGGTIDIGQVRIGNFGTAPFTVANTGVITALPVTVSTTLPLDIPPPASANVTPGLPEMFTVRCTPAGEQQYSEDVVIDAPTAFGPTSAMFEVRCEGVVSDVTITPAASFDFGGVRIGRMVTQDFEVTNASAMAISFNAPTVTPPFRVVAPTAGGSLAPSESVTVTVEFTPTVEEEVMMDVTGLLTSEPGRVIGVRGHGTIASYTVTPGEVDLGTACVGDTLMTPVTLQVTGSSVLRVEQPDVVGDSVFALTSVAPGTLPRDLQPDESVDAIVRATPAIGEHRATLVWGTDLTPGDQTAVTLGVTGIEQGLAASPGAIDFGEVEAAFPASRMITVRVCATEPLSVTALLEGDAGFQLVGAPEATATAIASTPWTIVFAPQRRGEHTAVLRLVPEAGPPIDIELSGTNVDAGVTNYYSCGCNADTGGAGALVVLLALALGRRRPR